MKNPPTASLLVGLGAALYLATMARAQEMSRPVAGRATAALPEQTVLLRRIERVDPYRAMAVRWSEKSYVYMDVQDTTLDAARPGANFGAAQALTLAAGRRDRVLVKFGQLNRAVWRGSQVLSARLILHPVPGRFGPNVRLRLSRMSADWREGGADGEVQYWTSTWNSAFSSPRGNRVAWHLPGASGREDRRLRPTGSWDTSVSVDAATGALVLQGSGLTEDVRSWLARQYRNHGWVLEMVDPTGAKQPLSFYSSECMDKRLRPALEVTFAPTEGEGEARGVDLNVTYIERTPRFLRYHDDGETAYARKPFRSDNPGIMTRPLNGATQKWPKPGQLLTYTAHIKNTGFDRYAGPLDYAWTYNGKRIAGGTTAVNLPPEAETRLSVRLAWRGGMADIRDELLMLEVDPAGKIAEITRNNNAQTKYIKARTWKHWVERSVYDYGRKFLSAYGSYSFEDYLKWHEQMWNETFLDRSRFDGLAPDGCRQRVTLDEIEIVADGKLHGPIHRLADKPDFHFDGEWGAEWLEGSDAADPAKVQELKDFVRATRIFLEGSLIHELSHQVLGAFDVYWSNQEPSMPGEPNGKVKLKQGDTYVTRGSMFAYPGLMGGDDCRPNPAYTEGTGLYEAHTVCGLNAGTPYRNGFFGEWQYDLPRSCAVRLLAADGSGLPTARVTVWQCSDNRIDEKGLVAQGLATNAIGLLDLPMQESGEGADVTTATGHTLLRHNPFGRIDVVGVNVVLLLKIEALGQTDWRFVRLFDFNKAYWQGYRARYALPVPTNIVPMEVNWADDLADQRRATTSLIAEGIDHLVDGVHGSSWIGGPTVAGSWVRLDLGRPVAVAAVSLEQSQHHGRFFPRFHIEVSDDPDFRRDVTVIARQGPLSFAYAMANDRDIDPQHPERRWVTYGARPVPGRYLRIVSDEETDFTSLSSISVYGPAKVKLPLKP